MRLVKFLAHAGVASRRAAEGIVGEGRVTVDGEIVTDPARDVDDTRRVELDGRRVEPEPLEVHALNKPAGVVSTARDTHGRPTVVQLVRSRRRLYPVGRLDAETTGLILLTNDGELANRLTHPRYGVPKAYRVSLARPPGEREIEELRRGVRLDDGPTAPAEVERRGERVIEITIREGRKRQVRRMAEAVGQEVEALTRISIGPLELGDLRPGEARRLGPDEVDLLWQDARPMRTATKKRSGE
jgi:23S rRNA pseudouridine2605 synthase